MRARIDYRPLPATISNALCFMDGGVDEGEYVKKATQLVRKLVRSGSVDWTNYGHLEEYDDRVWAIIDSIISEG